MANFDANSADYRQLWNPAILLQRIGPDWIHFDSSRSIDVSISRSINFREFNVTRNVCEYFYKLINSL